MLQWSTSHPLNRSRHTQSSRSCLDCRDCRKCRPWPVRIEIGKRQARDPGKNIERRAATGLYDCWDMYKTLFEWHHSITHRRIALPWKTRMGNYFRSSMCWVMWQKLKSADLHKTLDKLDCQFQRRGMSGWAKSQISKSNLRSFPSCSEQMWTLSSAKNRWDDKELIAHTGRYHKTLNCITISSGTWTWNFHWRGPDQ